MSAQSDLFAAVDQKKVAAVKAALAAGADPNLEDDSGYRPLASALELKSKPVALALLEGGADPNLEGRRGSMLLTALEYLPEPEVIDALCARGAALDAVGGPKRLAALHVAVLRPKLDAAAQLLDHGAQIDIADGNQAFTPLHLTIDAGSATALKAARWLLERGADVNAVDDSGRNALTLALSRHSDAALHQALLDRGAKVASDALHHAADVSQNNAAAIAFVLAQGVDIDARDERGETALHKAVTCHSVGNVKALLAKGADTSLRNDDGQTPHDLAVEYSNAAIATLLAKGTGGATTKPTATKPAAKAKTTAAKAKTTAPKATKAAKKTATKVTPAKKPAKADAKRTAVKTPAAKTPAPKAKKPK